MCNKNISSNIIIILFSEFPELYRDFRTLLYYNNQVLADLLNVAGEISITVVVVIAAAAATTAISVPQHNLSFGSRTFHISAPKIWNSLPPHILQSQTLHSFRRRLKTYYC